MVEGSRYNINIPERVKELMVNDTVPENCVVTYTFNHGYETLSVNYDNGGSSEYAGTYHPDVVCETNTEDGRGVCEFCGTVWY